MHRPDANPDEMTAEDFICDFCAGTWREDRPMVEGHRGSLICGNCLAMSYRELWLSLLGEPLPEHDVCSLCLSNNGDPVWHSPMNEKSIVCKRCSKQSVVMLERDEEVGWKRPVA